ncbi:hypothetical protein G9A89_008736 [Geosiphon pyriformis]|nr:hypothetical protein G9A89_008736 [Geosiphon pyriformis]
MASSYASSSKLKRRNSQPNAVASQYHPEDFGPLSVSTGSLEMMSQVYPQPTSNVFPSNSASKPITQAHTAQLLDQHNFAKNCQSVLGLLTGTRTILEDLRETNNTRFVIQYPFVKSNNPRKPQRTQSFSEKNLVRLPVKRTNSLSSPFNPMEPLSNFQQEVKYRLLSSEDEFNSNINILKLDMQMQDSSSAEMASLEKGSIAHLLNVKIGKILNHLQNLSARIADKSSKVLVAGDLNAGKSTFVNALLRRNVLPVDQQPCTTLFCEVLDARENGGVEAVHGIKDIKAYNVDDPSTYTNVGFENLERVVSDNVDQYVLLKIYCQDRRLSNESLLHNGVVDIALIDCPGLNSDSLKTMAVFARQEEIDVIVFLVSAENHFTLSANQFLWNASNEKAYLFIVVNKFDEIKNKEKCRRMILDQIKQISPRTFEYHDDLVHFVSANSINFDGNPHHPQKNPEVDHLEESLRTFVLKKRSKSKLAPAGHYLRNILYDIGVLSEFNGDIAKKEFLEVKKELEEGEPGFKKLKRDADKVVEEAESLAEATCVNIQKTTKQRLSHVILNVHEVSDRCEYHSFLYVWNYAIELRNNMLQVIQDELRQTEFKAKLETKACIEKIHSSAVQNLHTEPDNKKLEKCFTSKNNHHIQIHIDPSDFFDFNLNFDLDLGSRVNEGVGTMIGLSSTALVMFGGKVIGYNQITSALWKFTSIMGINNLQRMAIPFIGMAGIGFAWYVVSDARHAVSRNVARKIRDQLTTSNYADEQATRIAHQGRKATRRSINHLRDCFRRAIEAEEQKRQQQIAQARRADEAKFYFSSVLSKAEEMSKVLEALGIDVIEDEVLEVK